MTLPYLTDSAIIARGFAQVLNFPYKGQQVASAQGPQVNIPGASSLALTTAFSVSFFWKPFANSSGSRTTVIGTMFSYQGASGTIVVIKNSGAASGGYRITMTNTAAASANFNSTSIASRRNTWTHTALTWDAITARAYTNGLADGTASLSGTLSYTTANPVQFGTSTSGGGSANSPYPGLLCGVRLYKSTLSATDVLSLYRGGLTSGEANLIGSWKGNGSGKSVFDSSGNHNNGTLLNGVQCYNLAKRKTATLA